MELTIITRDQPRHLHLVGLLRTVSKRLNVVVEESPPMIWNNASDRADVRYLRILRESEAKYFSTTNDVFDSCEVVRVQESHLGAHSSRIAQLANRSDACIVFGSSQITDPLLSTLQTGLTLNVHLGISPAYRGTACNFWALFDDNPHLVGATIHGLNRHIDAGPIYARCRPRYVSESATDFGMKACLVAQQMLAELVRKNEVFNLVPGVQDQRFEIRYSRSRDFNENVARAFLAKEWDASLVRKRIASRSLARDFGLHSESSVNTRLLETRDLQEI